MSDFLETADRLIRIPSTEDNLAALEEATALVEEQFAGIDGINTRKYTLNDKPSLLVFSGDTIPEEFDVLLSGHLDVVPGTPEQFEPEIRDGYLYGRGAVDMKVTALGMARVLRETMPRSPYKLGGLFTTQEETEGADVKYLTEHGIVAAKFVVVGEGGNPTEICTEYKGMAYVTIDFAGTRSHESRPWEGRNAIATMGRFLAALETVYPEPNESVWRTTASPVLVNSANTTANQIPDHAMIGVSFRHIPGDPNFAEPGVLRSFLESLLSYGGDLITIHGLERPIKVDPDNPFIRQLANAVESVHGEPARYIRKHGSCDGRFFSNAVVYGMTGEGLHSDNERLDISSIDPYIQTLSQFLGNLSLKALQA